MDADIEAMVDELATTGAQRDRAEIKLEMLRVIGESWVGQQPTEEGLRAAGMRMGLRFCGAKILEVLDQDIP